MAVQIWFGRVVPPVVYIALFREGQAGNKLGRVDELFVCRRGLGRSIRIGTVLLVGNIIEAIGDVRERSRVVAIGVVQEHRTFRIIRLRPDTLGEGCDDLIGNRHLRGIRVGLHVNVKAVKANGGHVCFDDMVGIHAIIRFGRIIDALALLSNPRFESVNHNTAVIQTSYEFDATGMQIRRVIALELVIERLGRRFLTTRNITEHIDDIDTVWNIVHGDPIVVRQIGVRAFHSHITPCTVVHHEMLAAITLLRLHNGGILLLCIRNRSHGQRTSDHHGGGDHTRRDGGELASDGRAPFTTL